jgi:hypothetical protein
MKPRGRESSIRTATGYGLEGPGIESGREGEFSHTSRPALGHTQHPVQWVLSLSRGYSGQGVVMTTNHILAPRSRMSKAITLLLGTSGHVRERTLLTGTLKWHWILHHTVFKVSFLIRNHEVALLFLALLLNSQQFGSATVVRKCLVVLRYIILHFGENCLWNNISNKVANYSERRNR